MTYLLDTNAYLEAKQRYYRFNICPGFWHWLTSESHPEELLSVKPVLEELKYYEDDLSGWAKNNARFFASVDDENTQAYFAGIAEFVAGHEIFQERHKASFLDAADPWLIAKAMTLGATLVTHEKLEASNSTKVKIPNICQEFSVPYCDTFDLLERSDVVFVLG
ncbi:DUF4411 family protein [Salicola sp. Rm-C-2C1-2]|uniref:DUF4411 family protein n=1 Tax=Salicola sp. Rm-C-2C1-2 TaxID=3141321 RepID=UPI0032E3E6EA